MSAAQKTLKAGEVLFQEGDEARSLFLVLKGKISVQRRGGSSAVELAQIGQNQIVGELSFFDGKSRSASAVATEETEVAEVPFAALTPIFEKSPDYLKKIMTSLAQRLRTADETIETLKRELGKN